MKKIIFYILLLFCFLIQTSVYAEDFDIENYDINMNVNKDNSININENIKVKFFIPKHGIFRNILVKNYVEQQNGENYKRNAYVADIKSNKKYSMYRNGNDVVLKFGDADILVSDVQDYIFSYLYKLDADPLEDKDEFYFNIIGTGWDVNIHKVNFKIYMPKEIDSSKVGISVGRYGNVGYTDGSVIYNVYGDTITGYTTRALSAHEAITIRIELPEGYFIKPTPNYMGIFITIFFSIILTFLVYFIWYAYGKDENVIPVVNFYPPKGINSAELGVLYDHSGHANLKNVVSLIVYLASKGYIKITMSGGDDFTITKLKDYDGNNPIEKTLFYILEKEMKCTNILTYNDLKCSKTFYKKCDDLAKEIEKLRNKIFEKNSISIKTYIFSFLCLLGLVCIFWYSLHNFTFNFDGNQISILVFYVINIITSYFGYAKSPNIIYKILCAIWLLLNVVGLMLNHIFQYILDSSLSTKISIIPLIGIVISLICIKELPKRNQIGLKLLGHILGFKKFIETAELDKIRSLIKDDPEYAYNLLPYVYILGLEKAWVEKIEQIAKIQLDWFEGNIYHFHNFTNSMYSVSAPSVSNGGISSSSGGGGGFSGGGCGGGGGGGGGSW